MDRRYERFAFCVAVIGTGRVGERHAKTLNKLDVPLALYDTDIVKSVTLARSFGLNNAFAYERLDFALEFSYMVYVCTPFVNHLHMEPIRLAAEQGSTIFCEKPITDNLKDAYTIKEIVTKSRVPFVVGNYHLLNLPIEELLEKYKEGEIGQARELNLSYIHNMTLLFAGSWRNKENYLYDAGVHPIDLALLIAGEEDPVTTVSARTNLEEDPKWKGDYYLELGFKSGMPAKIHLGYRPQKLLEEQNIGVRAQILGTDGMLEASSLGTTLTISKDRHSQVLELPQGSIPLPVNRVARIMLGVHKGIIKDYYPLPGIDRAIKSIQILTAAEESIKNGGTAITLPS